MGRMRTNTCSKGTVPETAVQTGLDNKAVQEPSNPSVATTTLTTAHGPKCSC